MRVVVLMSTYNGERYVEEQLRSILDQLPERGHIQVRDDGSTDATVARIQAFGDERITLKCGANLGFARSFLTLMADAPDDADMYMLSDQDDVWLPEKIARAWLQLKDRLDEPVLYCSRMQLVDVNLKPIELSINWPRPPSFENALTENIVTGCTAAFTRAVRRLALAKTDTSLIHFHDWWLYLVTAAFGRVVFDPQPTILYRQHDGNAIGMGAGFRRYWTILKFILKTSWVKIMFDQLHAFSYAHSGSLDSEHMQQMNSMFYPRRWQSAVALIFSSRLHRQSLSGEVLFRTLLLVELVRSLPPISFFNGSRI